MIDESRALYRRLIDNDLPAAAQPHWSVRLNHCFARIILDHVCDGPWRQHLAAPAYRHMDEAQLQQAVALAQAILNGTADLSALNRQSLIWRGKLKP